VGRQAAQEIHPLPTQGRARRILHAAERRRHQHTDLPGPIASTRGDGYEQNAIMPLKYCVKELTGHQLYIGLSLAKWQRGDNVAIVRSTVNQATQGV
jgi:hypothetical protein